MTVRRLAIEPLARDAFVAFGTVIPPTDHREGFGPNDAKLDLTHGTPRFYTMLVPGRGFAVDRITRHRRVTQVLASAGNQEWAIAVAPPENLDDPDAEPSLEAIRAFSIPGDTAIMLAAGTWHAGPLFDPDGPGGERSFFNLELTDTNVVDHQTCSLVERYNTTLLLV